MCACGYVLTLFLYSILYICIYVALAPIFPWAPDVSRHVRPRRSNPTSAAPAPPAPPAAPARRAAAAPRGAPWVSEDARAPWRDEVMFQLNFLGKPWKKPRFLGDFLGIWWNMEYTGEIYAGFIGEKWIKLSSSKKTCWRVENFNTILKRFCMQCFDMLRFPWGMAIFPKYVINILGDFPFTLW